MKGGKATVFPAPPTDFPDAATCQVRRWGTDDIYECLGRWGANCKHMIYFDRQRFCRHPAAEAGLIRPAPNAAAGAP